jgi:hypothetical protein
MTSHSEQAQLPSNESHTVEFVWLCTGVNCSEIYFYDAGRCFECHHGLKKWPAWRRTHETKARVNPFDAAAILADSRARRISMSFETQAQYEAALLFLGMGDIQTRPLYRCADESCPGHHLSAASVCKPSQANGDPR